MAYFSIFIQIVVVLMVLNVSKFAYLIKIINFRDSSSYQSSELTYHQFYLCHSLRTTGIDLSDVLYDFQEFLKAPPCPSSQDLTWTKPPARPLILQAPLNPQTQQTSNPEHPRGNPRWRRELACWLPIFVIRSLS